MASVGSRSSAVRSDAHQNAGDSAAARQRRQRVCTGFPGCFSFLGEAAGACCRCCRGCSCSCVLENRAGARERAAWRSTTAERPVAANRRTGPGRRSWKALRRLAGHAEDPAATGKSTRQTRESRGPALDTTTTAARAARGDGRQPRREHRHRWRPPTAPTHENKSGGQLPATSPTASAISFLPTVQQRGRVGHVQSPRHRTISWNGVYQEESPISHFGGPEAGQFTITPFLCRYRKERRISSAITLSRSP